MTRKIIINTYLKTIGKTWEEITAHERTVLSSFAEELLKITKAPTAKDLK